MRKDYEPPAPNQPIAYMEWQCFEGFRCLQTKADLLNYIANLENRIELLQYAADDLDNHEIGSNHSDAHRIEKNR